MELTKQVSRLGPTKVKFIFKCGHSEIKDFSKGPVARRIPADGLNILFKYWERSGVYIRCKKCKKGDT